MTDETKLPLSCGNCGRTFSTKKGKGRHKRSGNCDPIKERQRELSRLPTKVRIELLDDIAGDMPDGAYWAMADEMGLDPSDFV